MKRHRKERPWIVEDEQITRELRRGIRTIEEGRGLIAGAPHYRPSGFWRNFR